MVLDDGIVLRLADDRFLATVSSSHAQHVLSHFEFWRDRELPAWRCALTSGGTPVASVSVQAYSPSSSTTVLQTGFTQVDGTYSIPGLSSGSYLLRAVDNQGRYVSEWYADAADFNTATIVSLASVDTTANFDLSPGGRIAGTVTSGGTAVSNVTVSFYRAADNGSWWLTR